MIEERRQRERRTQQTWEAHDPALDVERRCRERRSHHSEARDELSQQINASMTDLLREIQELAVEAGHLQAANLENALMNVVRLMSSDTSVQRMLVSMQVMQMTVMDELLRRAAPAAQSDRPQYVGVRATETPFSRRAR